ncbi:ectoine/hydroxyectoine ABC transporter permease subunit EhuC [Streptomyces sp. 16-176A]|uniref:ectoine/hydroxyectoine ABC transporter permease subunit EhuC n=1 Tax=Streptomyces sp. 16-176A TaxID=2530458 RepID=UPI00345CC0F3
MTTGLWELVLRGLWTTLQLLFFSALLAGAVSFAVGVARTHRLWIVRFLAGFYTEVFRGTSALVMIFWVFFVLPPAFGWQLVPMWAGTLALGLTYGAYGSEIVRGALNAVDPAQREGGIALSFTPWQRLRLILLPQAVPEMIPSFCNLLVELLKGTSLVSIMGMGDLAFSGNLVRLALQESAEIYTYLLIGYFLIAFALTRLMRGLEKRLKRGIGKDPLDGAGARAVKRAATTGVGAAGSGTSGVGAARTGTSGMGAARTGTTGVGTAEGGAA